MEIYNRFLLNVDTRRSKSNMFDIRC